MENKEFCVATDRFDLKAEEVAFIYKLRLDIEIFFGWWKQHLKVYRLIARSPNGLMAQIIRGLITYLLLAIYYHEEHQEKVRIQDVRELRITMHNEIIQVMAEYENDATTETSAEYPAHASP